MRVVVQFLTFTDKTVYIQVNEWHRFTLLKVTPDVEFDSCFHSLIFGAFGS